MAIEPREYRNAVGCFATGVTIVTTLDHDGEKIGITANAFESCRHFNVNVLHEDQMDLSNTFARSSADKWEGVEHAYGENGCPVFEGALAVLECDKHAMYEGGDHLIMIGEVTGMKYDNGDSRPLLYYKGAYGKIG